MKSKEKKKRRKAARRFASTMKKEDHLDTTQSDRRKKIRDRDIRNYLARVRKRIWPPQSADLNRIELLGDRVQQIYLTY
jgi:hypothetical protein